MQNELNHQSLNCSALLFPDYLSHSAPSFWLERLLTLKTFKTQRPFNTNSLLFSRLSRQEKSIDNPPTNPSLILFLYRKHSWNFMKPLFACPSSYTFLSSLNHMIQLNWKWAYGLQKITFYSNHYQGLWWWTRLIVMTTDDTI